MIDARSEFLQKASSRWIAGGAPNIKKRETDAFVNNFHRASQNVHIFHISQLLVDVSTKVRHVHRLKKMRQAARFFRVGKKHIYYSPTPD